MGQDRRLLAVSVLTGICTSMTGSLILAYMGGPDSTVSSLLSTVGGLNLQILLVQISVASVVVYSALKLWDAIEQPNKFILNELVEPEGPFAPEPPDEIYWRGYVFTGDDGQAWPVEFGIGNEMPGTFAYVYNPLCWDCGSRVELEQVSRLFGLWTTYSWNCPECGDSYFAEKPIVEKKRVVAELCESELTKSLARGNLDNIEESNWMTTEDWSPPRLWNKGKWWMNDVEYDEIQNIQ